MANYNENYDFEYHTDDEEFDVEHLNSNFNVAAEEFDAVYDLMTEKASNSHGHNLSNTNISGVLPVSKGGTGANTVDNARNNLGLGNASTRGITDTVEENNDNLMTSNGVYKGILSKRLIYTVALSNAAKIFKDKANFIIDTTQNISEQIVSVLNNLNSLITNDNNLRGTTIMFMPGTYLISEDLVLTDYSNFTFKGFAGNTTFNIESETKIILNSNASKFYNIEFNNIMFNKTDCSYDTTDCIFYCKNINGIKFKECSFSITGNTNNVRGQAIICCEGTIANLTITGGSVSSNFENCINSYMVDLVGTKNNTLSIMLGEVRSSKHISINFPNHDRGKGTTTYAKWGLWSIDEYTDGVMNN